MYPNRKALSVAEPFISVINIVEPFYSTPTRAFLRFFNPFLLLEFMMIAKHGL